MARFRAQRPKRRPLGDHTYAVLRAVQNATLGGSDAVTLEVALQRSPTPQDWRSAALLAERGLISAESGAVRIRADGARVLGRIP